MEKSPTTRTLEDQLREIAYDERLVSRKDERSSTVKKIAAAIIFTAGIATIYVGANSLEGESPEEVAQKLEFNAEKEIKNNKLQVSNEVIVLNQGAKVRETPARYVFNPESGSKDRNVDNVAYQVGEDQNIIITKSLIWQDSDKEQWLGFFIKLDDEEKPSLRWINRDALLNDSIKDNGESESESQSPMTIMSTQNLTPSNYMAILNKEGTLIGVSDSKGVVIANASIVDSQQTTSILNQLGAGK